MQDVGKHIRAVAGGTIFKNMVALGAVQFANYLIPLIIIPFVTRALGVDMFGRVCYAQNIVSYLAILINFGFDYSATQDVAIHKGDKRAVGVIFRTVMVSKAVLFAVSIGVMGVLYAVYAPVHADPVLYAWAALFNLGYVLFPTWLYQGMEDMGRMSVMNFVTKLTGAVLIIAVVREAEDYVAYMAILSAVYVVVGCVALMYAVRHYGVLESRTRDGALSRAIIRKSCPIFVTTLAGSLYNAMGLTLLGAMMSAAEVGVYAGSQKVILACVMLTSMSFSVAIFPKMSRLFEENRADGWRFFGRAMGLAIAVGLCMTPCIWLLAPLAVKILLGSGFEEAVVQIRWMSGLPLLVLIGTMLTVQGLYGTQQQRWAPIVVVLSGCISVALNRWLIPVWHAGGCVVAWYVAESVEIMIVGGIIINYKRMTTRAASSPNKSSSKRGAP